MKNNEQIVYGCIGATVTLILVIVLSSILNGWVLSILWGWFIVPIFELPSLPIAEAIGFATIVTFLTRHSTKTDGDKVSGWINVAVQLTIPPLAYLAFGYVVHLFM